MELWKLVSEWKEPSLEFQKQKKNEHVTDYLDIIDSLVDEQL